MMRIIEKFEYKELVHDAIEKIVLRPFRGHS